MRIALFVTCLTDTLFPGTGQAVVRLLERFGGTFSIKNPDVSAAMCADKIAAVQRPRSCWTTGPGRGAAPSPWYQTSTW